MAVVHDIKLEDMLFSVILTIEEDKPKEEPPIKAQLGWTKTDCEDYVLEECPLCGSKDPDHFTFDDRAPVGYCEACNGAFEDHVPESFEAWPFRSSRKFSAVLTFDEFEELLYAADMDYECETCGMLGAPGAIPWYGMLPALSFRNSDRWSVCNAYVCPIPAIITPDGLDAIPGIELPMDEETLEGLFTEMKARW